MSPPRWPTLETAGIVLFLLTPLLLEYVALRDRLARMLGAAELGLASAAVPDASERLSRLLVLQFAVRLLVGAAIWAGLAVLGPSHSVLLAHGDVFMGHARIFLTRRIAGGVLRRRPERSAQ
jgi:predicted PurR-regulated permease PerM